MLKLLVDHRISLDARDQDGKTPLHVAAEYVVLKVSFMCSWCGWENPSRECSAASLVTALLHEARGMDFPIHTRNT